jgi:hypothetical protein
LLGDRREAAGDAGIGEDDVEVAVLRGSLLDQALHVLFGSGICLNVGVVAHVRAHHGCAFASEQLDRRLADSRCRAGDDCDLACQSLHRRYIASGGAN